MIILIVLLSLISLVAVITGYCVLRVSVWKNRALIIIIISALYFLSVFMIFSRYGGIVG